MSEQLIGAMFVLILVVSGFLGMWVDGWLTKRSQRHGG